MQDRNLTSLEMKDMHYFFKPGDYGTSLEINVGFYTQVLGLGILPTDTNINKLWVNADWMFHNATCNFWRSAENFSVNDYCMWG